MTAPFSYRLPRERIAQRPVHPYDAARLLIANRETGSLRDSIFSNLADFLRAGDLLVFNDSRVIPARLYGKLESGAEAEVLLHRRVSVSGWRCLGQPLRKFRVGKTIAFPGGLKARIGVRHSEYEVALEFFSNDEGVSPDEMLYSAGVMPIPPYIRDGHGDEEDRTDYQSLFARVDGSVAAPTASLHFTPELLSVLKDRGVETASLTLHVGAASFLPVYDGGQALRRPGKESFVFDPEIISRCSAVRAAGGRVVAVGTTVVRALETMARLDGQTVTGMETELFIEPGFEFRMIDCLITNFHQPGTTHLLLVEALLGAELLSRSYEYALTKNFRFLSYGDGMLIL